MYKKLLKLLQVITFAGIAGCTLVACNSGGANAINVSAGVVGGANGTQTNNGNCTNMTTGSTCQIQLTMNDNAQPALNLTYTPSPLPSQFVLNPAFASSISNCQTQIDAINNNQIQCNINIVYTSLDIGAPNSNSINLTFYLGNAVNSISGSNSITISGD